MKPDVLRALYSLGILVSGTATVVILALQHVIIDGETVAALSAVLTATVGSHALNSRGGGDDA